MRLLSFVHVCNYCSIGSMYALATFLLGCVDVMVMPSAYQNSSSAAGGCAMSDVYMSTNVIG